MGESHALAIHLHRPDGAGPDRAAPVRNGPQRASQAPFTRIDQAALVLGGPCRDATAQRGSCMRHSLALTGRPWPLAGHAGPQKASFARANPICPYRPGSSGPERAAMGRNGPRTIWAVARSSLLMLPTEQRHQATLAVASHQSLSPLLRCLSIKRLPKSELFGPA